MKIVSLEVENFRAIHRIELSMLQDMVVIAGPNGCGKSCILDSIRLFKSVYGGYQPDEWQQWFGEFQINFQRNPRQMASLLRDRNRPSVISVGIELATEEVYFIESLLPSMLEDIVWKTVVPGMQDPWLRARGALAAELRAHKPVVDKKVKELEPTVRELLKKRVQLGQLVIEPTGSVRTTNNILLELVFSSFHPKHLGVIDYHGSHRNYGREELGGINLNLDKDEERFRTTSLYNYANKYANIKSEMAADYVRRALQEKTPSGISPKQRTKALSETLQELFTIFFPGKTFLGPVPTDDGNLTFPVELQGGAVHDINDLSSGEKEVLFGYLRLRNSAPRFSIILLDEPELHLNPALVRGLPQFYHKHLGIELENQIWLVTHSDAFLREAMGHKGLRVFHMQHSGVQLSTENQIHEIQAGEEVESIILEMVGDLAAYRPGAKIVFFEGENSEFDKSMVSRLFPAIENDMNLVSAGSRYRVEALHKTLERSVQEGKIPIKIYSVVDKDSGLTIKDDGEVTRHFSWDVYHIENYLLEAQFIEEALKDLNVSSEELSSTDEIERRLREIAQTQIDKLVSHKITLEIDRELVGQLRLKTNPVSDDIGSDLHQSIRNSIERIELIADDKYDLSYVQGRVEEERKKLEESLTNGNWKQHFMGREILRLFVGKYVMGMGYEYFRDLIIGLMVKSNYQPNGMKKILNRIISD